MVDIKGIVMGEEWERRIDTYLDTYWYLNGILNVNTEDEIYKDLENHDDIDLGLCLEYFDQNYNVIVWNQNMMVQWKTVFTI